MSVEIGTEASDAAADAEQPAVPQTNFERLGAHLNEDSLAAKLVSACGAADDGAHAQAIKDVIADRLDELKNSHDNPEDQQN